MNAKLVLSILLMLSYALLSALRLYLGFGLDFLSPEIKQEFADTYSFSRLFTLGFLCLFFFFWKSRRMLGLMYFALGISVLALLLFLLADTGLFHIKSSLISLIQSRYAPGLMALGLSLLDVLFLSYMARLMRASILKSIPLSFLIASLIAICLCLLSSSQVAFTVMVLILFMLIFLLFVVSAIEKMLDDADTRQGGQRLLSLQQLGGADAAAVQLPGKQQNVHQNVHQKQQQKQQAISQQDGSHALASHHKALLIYSACFILSFAAFSMASSAGTEYLSYLSSNNLQQMGRGIVVSIVGFGLSENIITLSAIGMAALIMCLAASISSRASFYLKSSFVLSCAAIIMLFICPIVSNIDLHPRASQIFLISYSFISTSLYFIAAIAMRILVCYLGIYLKRDSSFYCSGLLFANVLIKSMSLSLFIALLNKVDGRFFHAQFIYAMFLSLLLVIFCFYGSHLLSKESIKLQNWDLEFKDRTDKDISDKDIADTATADKKIAAKGRADKDIADKAVADKNMADSQSNVHTALQTADSVSVMKDFAHHYALSERELEIASFLQQGRGRAYIAQALHLSEHTIRNYTSSLYQKCMVSNKQELLDLIVTFKNNRPH